MRYAAKICERVGSGEETYTRNARARDRIGKWKLSEENSAQSKATATTAANMNEHYSLLKLTLEEQGSMSCSSRIYNMDKSGMPLDDKPPRVIAHKGTKKNPLSHIWVKSCKSPSLPVLMLRVPLFLQWWYLMDKGSIQNGVRGMYLIRFSACHRKGGLTKNCSHIGWQISLSNTFSSPSCNATRRWPLFTLRARHYPIGCWSRNCDVLSTTSKRGTLFGPYNI